MTGEADVRLGREQLRTDEWELDLDPERAGWRYSGLRIARLDGGERREVETGEDEVLFIPLSGALEVAVDGSSYPLRGRSSVFDGPTDVLYVPRESRATVSSAGPARFALATARATRRFPVQFRPAEAIPTEVRGGGSMTRYVRDVGGVGVIEADRLIACEVVTPRANWSSYPPHKHDAASDTESELEEVYYFESSGASSLPIGYARLQPSDARPIDALMELREGDTVLVPYGWHGPVIASPVADLYQLNVMAGPSERAWRVTDHPEYSWVRTTW